MGIVTSSSFAKALYPGVSKWWGAAYEDWKVQHTDLFEQHTSRRAYEEDVQQVGTGLAAIKREGQAISYDSLQQGFITRYNHVVYGLGFIITREMVDDDLYGVIGPKRARALARSLRLTKEVVAANVYNRAFNSTYKGGDAKELLATDHPNFTGGTYANELTTATDLSEAALEQACIDISRLEDDRGLQIALAPKCLIIPNDLMFEAERILGSPYRVGTSDNDINALNAMGKFSEGIKVNTYLTDTDAWFIRTNLPEDGMKCYQRRDKQFGVDNDHDTETAKYKATERYSFGWTDPRGLFGSPGA
jgi:hypothetical protein